MPSFIQNMPIWQKCLLPIALLAAAAIAITLSMSSRMSVIDTAYRQLIDHEAKAVVAATQMNGRTYAIWSLAYQSIAKANAQDSQANLKAMAAEKSGFEKRAKELYKSLPHAADYQTEADALVADFAAIYATSERAITISQATTADAKLQAITLLQQDFQPVLKNFRATSNNLRNQLMERLDKSSANLTDTTNRTRATSSFIAVLSVILCAALGAWVALRGLVRPLKNLNHTMAHLAQRDWGHMISGKERRDEVGAMARTVESFKQNGLQADQIAQQLAADTAKRTERAQRLEQLVADFHAEASNLVSLVTKAAREMEATAKALAANASQSTGQASLVAEAAQRASAGVQTAASSAEQLAASIGEISRQVAQSADLTQQAVGEAQRTDNIVKALSEGAAKIGQVVDLITNIAGQTNLLALNATIEAARAGDAGKGFAVVASEVKSLAHQTANATQEISTQISQLQEATGQAVQAINAITGKITDISSIATTIASAVEEQGAATSEIARNVQQTAANTQDVTSNIVGVSQAAQHTGAAASQVFSAAGELSQKAENLTAEVRNFVANVRAA